MHTGASRIGRNNNKKNTLGRLRDVPAAPPPQGWTTRASGLKGNRWTFPLCRALCRNPATSRQGFPSRCASLPCGRGWESRVEIWPPGW